MEEDPAFLQALLDSYMEQTSSLLSSEQNRQDSSKLGQTPPASQDFIKKLPIIQLREEDLVDPVNRECCICLDDNQVGDLAVRLPHCSHIFHKECIFDWLQRKCTCPVCRHEYPTDDVEFEVERLEREQQQESKPRYARHELDRMTHAELMALLPDGDDDDDNYYQGDDRPDLLVDHLIQCGVVDVINLPDPCTEYTLSTLRKMNMTQLRKVMNKEAGVFWHSSKQVTSPTREEMIQIFISSGRLRILPEPVVVVESRLQQQTTTTTTKQQQPKQGLIRRHSAILNRVVGKNREAEWNNNNRGIRKKIRLFFTPRR